MVHLFANPAFFILFVLFCSVALVRPVMRRPVLSGVSALISSQAAGGTEAPGQLGGLGRSESLHALLYHSTMPHIAP